MHGPDGRQKRSDCQAVDYGIDRGRPLCVACEPGSKVKGGFRGFGLILCWAIVFPPAVISADKEIEIGTIMSHFVWRGIRLSEGPVYQSSLTVRSRGFWFNVWGNFDFDLAKFSEIDATLAYGRSENLVSKPDSSITESSRGKTVRNCTQA